MDYLSYVTAAAAFGGLVLGVFNTWRNLIEDRVKLRITALLDNREDDVDLVSVNIVNLSKFPLAVARAELTLKDGSTRKINRHGLGLRKSIRPRRNLPILYWLQKNHGSRRPTPRRRGVVHHPHGMRDQAYGRDCTARRRIEKTVEC